MDQETPPNIDILFDATESGLESKGIFTSGLKKVAVDTSKLKDGFERLVGSFGDVLSDIRSVGAFELDEVSFSVKVTSEGGVALVGTVKAGVGSTVTLRFKRGDSALG